MPTPWPWARRPAPGGIGFNLFMAGSFYFDLHEMGMLTYIVVIAVVLLEMLSTKIKAKVR